MSGASSRERARSRVAEPVAPMETSWGEVEEFESPNNWGSDLRIWHNGQRDGPVRSIVFRFAPVADKSGGARAVSHDMPRNMGCSSIREASGHTAAQDRDCRARPEAKHGLSIHLRSRRCDLGGSATAKIPKPD